MDTALRENSHFQRTDRGTYDTSLAVLVDDTILGHHLSDQVAVDDDLELGGAGVDVHGVHATRADAADSHAGAGADERGKSLAVGGDELAALARVLLRHVEVEYELLVIRQERVSVNGGVGEEELLRQAQRWSGGIGAGSRGGGRKGAEGQDGSGDAGGELHCDWKRD
jgi:hypothetical protein